MPELPEVETIRRKLEPSLAGKTITDIEVLYAGSFKGLMSEVIGATVTSLVRKGKVLSLALDNGKYLSIHLKMAGQLFWSPSLDQAVFNIKIPLAADGRMPARTTRVVIHFSDRSLLFFNDLRKFGWVKVSDVADGTNAPDVTKPEFTLEYFTDIVSRSRKPIKTLLMDQDKMAGVGNIYANDALFTAGILPSRISSSLDASEIERLHTAVIQTILEGIEFQGTSASDVYRLPDGNKGSYQDRFKVYSLQGKPCKVCGTPIIREKVGGRSNFYCPVCQK